MLLEVRDLRTEFDTKHGASVAVDSVSFSVERGEILAIVGESGSGKSVTSLSIMGLLQPPGKVAAGEILFNGEDLLKKSHKEMLAIRGDRISMIFQEPMTSLDPMYRVGNQIAECIKTHNKGMSKQEIRDRMLEMMRRVNIPQPEKRCLDYPHQMSGGMRQRVMIAMAMSCSPDLLIADEPTTALDVTIQAQILSLLYQMRDEFHNSVLLITHDLGIVSEASDRVLVMYCGKIVEEGKTDELLENPLHPYTVGLIKSIPSVEGEDQEHLYMIEGMIPDPLHLPPGCAFSDRCDRCMERCTKEMPELLTIGERKVRCFLYDEGNGGGENRG